MFGARWGSYVQLKHAYFIAQCMIRQGKIPPSFDLLTLPLQKAVSGSQDLHPVRRSPCCSSCLLDLTSNSSKALKTESMVTVNTNRKEHWDTLMENALAQCNSNYDMPLIKTGELTQSSHTGSSRSRAFTATAVCAARAAAAAEVVRPFFFLKKKTNQTPICEYLPWNRNMKQPILKTSARQIPFMLSVLEVAINEVNNKPRMYRRSSYSGVQTTR